MLNSNLPIVSVTASPAFTTEVGAAPEVFTFSLSQPAPVGGLKVNMVFFDTDSIDGDEILTTENIDELGSVSINNDAGSIVNSITIAEGATQARVILAPVQDDIIEEPETNYVFLIPGEGYQVNPNRSTASTTLLDSTEPPIVGLTIPTITVIENGQAKLVFNLSRPAPAGGLTIDFVVGDSDPNKDLFIFNTDDSTNIDDYQNLFEDGDILAPQVVTISEGATQATLVLDIPDDGLGENPEFLTWSLSEGAGYEIDPDHHTDSFTLIDPPEQVVVSLTVPTLTVMEDGQAKLAFNLSQPAPEGGLTVDFVVEDSDPNKDLFIFNTEDSINIDDYQNLFEEGDTIAPQVVTISEGATQATLVFDIPDDGLVEEPEILTWSLSQGTGYGVDPDVNTDSFTLIDIPMQPVVSLRATPKLVEEGSQLNWHFKLSEPVPAGGMTVELELTQDTDPMPGDVSYYVEGSKNITSFELIKDGAGVITGARVGIAEGARYAKLVNDVIADGVEEGVEKAVYTLIDGADYDVNTTKNKAKINLIDDITVPIVSVGVKPDLVTEGNRQQWQFSLAQPVPAGGLTLDFDLTLNTDPEPGDMTYNVKPGKNITSFELIRDPVTDALLGAKIGLAEGATSAKLFHKATPDDLEEGLETFVLELQNGEGYYANPLKNELVVNIVDVPVVGLTVPTATVEEDTLAKLVFDLSQPAPEGGLTIDFIVEDSDPNKDIFIFNTEASINIDDYQNLFEEGDTLAPQVVKISEGATQATLVFDIPDDDLVESPELLTWTLVEGIGYGIDTAHTTDSFTLVDAGASADSASPLSAGLNPLTVTNDSQLFG